MTVLFYILNVAVIALPLAIFEIWLEKFKTGWGGEFRNPFWGKKIKIGFLNKAAEKTYLSVYHLVMFGLVLPGIFIVEYLILRRFALHTTWWKLDFGTFSIVPLVYLPTVWLGVAVLEDFLWFALNWRYPNTF